ncbi:BTB/POZ domain-containing protein [Ditylenchus destructor]|uniref:BTB/POZ domain-containing protein n=1 Tax=Ditylenchus destructor TaxID=166010 RepID=A0AAD4R9K8_9BILA|nr:BTB/POZ domain-containing protein [Ditylenchus destructor]
MTDIGINHLRPSDSWSSTEVRSLQHTHMWTIKGFSQCECRYLETSVKIKDCQSGNGPLNDSNLSSPSPMTFRIRLHPQGNKESNKDFCFFQVFSCSSASVTKFKAKFSVFNTRNEEVPATVYTGTQQLNGYFEYIRRDLLISHIAPQDEIQLMLHLTIVSDTVTKSSQTASIAPLPEPRPSELASDFERIFNHDRHTDFKIICRNDKDIKEIKVHKIVLSARSPVFSAMLENHTEEAQNNQVTYADIDYEVMHEMLFFMYSGHSPNLSQMALDLLAVADRFQLNGLKEMADQILRSGLTVENVCRNLVLADMHNAHDLKADAIRFIAQYSNSVIEVKEHPRLVTEVVAAMGQDSSRLSSTEPSAKRLRFD